MQAEESVKFIRRGRSPGTAAGQLQAVGKIRHVGEGRGKKFNTQLD